jgi:hypothetical protein
MAKQAEVETRRQMSGGYVPDDGKVALTARPRNNEQTEVRESHR